MGTVLNHHSLLLFMHMSTSFSAAAGFQALGYIYQTQYALYTLLTADGEESALILEGVALVIRPRMNCVKSQGLGTSFELNSA